MADETPPTSPPVVPPSPNTSWLQSTLDWASRYAPETVALSAGALALLSVAIFAISFAPSLKQLAWMVTLVIAVGALGQVMAYWVRRRPPKFLPEVFTWVVAVVALVVLCAMAWGLFNPERSTFGKWIWSQVLPLEDLHTAATSKTIVRSFSSSDLGEVGREPSTESRDARLASLAARGTVHIRGNDTPSLTDRTLVAAHTIVLDTARIVTGDKDLHIEAVDLIVNGPSRIVAFPDKAAVAGQPGRSGGKISITVHRKVVGQLEFDLSGTAGAPGAQGPPGPPGVNGTNGSNGVSTLIECRSGPGAGGNGANGGQGGRGQDGFVGGKGGDIVVKSPLADVATRLSPRTLNGGPGGAGGPGGPGGAGGRGGDGGGPRGHCHGSGSRGADGVQGPTGQSGGAGAGGATGTFTLAPL